VLSAMPRQSADCIVTSPSYWAKRDYGVTGQYGHEPDPDAYISTLRAVFAEARRVLADDGTCWLNLGDCYSAGGDAATGLHAYLGSGLAGRRAAGVAAKDLLGLPWRAALALQADGWIRSRAAAMSENDGHVDALAADHDGAAGRHPAQDSSTARYLCSTTFSSRSMSGSVTDQVEPPCRTSSGAQIGLARKCGVILA
jgi:DNA methylase